jgi:putative addiction module component (TIGR02574 family)
MNQIRGSGLLDKIDGIVNTQSEWILRFCRRVAPGEACMSTSFQLPNFSQLSVAERIVIVEQIWDSIAAEQGTLPLTPAQEAELDRRLESYRQSPTAGASWDDAKARIQAKK